MSLVGYPSMMNPARTTGSISSAISTPKPLPPCSRDPMTLRTPLLGHIYHDPAITRPSHSTRCSRAPRNCPLRRPDHASGTSRTFLSKSGMRSGSSRWNGPEPASRTTPPVSTPSAALPKKAMAEGTSSSHTLSRPKTGPLSGSPSASSESAATPGASPRILKPASSLPASL